MVCTRIRSFLLAAMFVAGAGDGEGCSGCGDGNGCYYHIDFISFDLNRQMFEPSHKRIKSH